MKITVFLDTKDNDINDSKYKPNATQEKTQQNQDSDVFLDSHISGRYCNQMLRNSINKS